jgi:hypothetical protein
VMVLRHSGVRAKVQMEKQEREAHEHGGSDDVAQHLGPLLLRRRKRLHLIEFVCVLEVLHCFLFDDRCLRALRTGHSRLCGVYC